MKKGLLSILAGALVVVGCQNYDDQFDQLESQINALASTVAGLSAVQSDLAALSAQVNGLSGAVDAAVDSALAGGLAQIQEAIDALNAAAAEAADNTAVGAIQTEIDDIQTDLDDLLRNSSIFQGDVIINSVSTLAVYADMGSALNIVNGKVDIDVDSEMDIATVQTVVDNILITIEDFSYTSDDSGIAEVTFNNLSGTTTLTVEQAGGYQFAGLESADLINLGDEFSSSILTIDFSALASVDEFQTEGVADTIDFSKAMTVNLSSLAYVESGELTIITDEGADLDISSLDDEDPAGDEESLDLTIEGPAAVVVSAVAKGNFDFTDVAAVTLTDFRGSTTLNGGVVSFTSNHVESLTFTDADDLETLDITAAKATDSDGDVDDDTLHGPSLTLDELSSLETVDIDGDVNTLTISENGNLETLTLGGVIASLSVTDNSDLLSMAVEGAEIGNVTVTGNGDLAILNLEHTSKVDADDDTSFPESVAINVSDNVNLEELWISADDVSSLTIQGNHDLETVNFEGLTDAGGAEEVTVLIGSITDKADRNALSADTVTDSYDEDADDPDTGEIDSESGISTIKTYLDNVVAAASLTGIKVYLDEVDTYIQEAEDRDDNVETTNLDFDSATTAAKKAMLTIMEVTGDIVDDTTPVYQKRTVVIKPRLNALYAEQDFAATEDITIDLSGVSVTFAGDDEGITDIASQLAAIDAADDWGVNWNVTTGRGGYETAYVVIDFTNSDGNEETVATGGDFYVKFGDVTAAITAATGDDQDDLAGDIAAALDGENVAGFTYGLSATDNVITITRDITGTGTTDDGPGAVMPAVTLYELQLSDNLTSTLVWGDNASNLAGQDSDWYIATTTANSEAAWIQIEGTSTTVAANWANDTITIADGDANTGAFANVTATLVSGTNFGNASEAYALGYKADFADIVVPAATIEGSDTDRTAWL